MIQAFAALTSQSHLVEDWKYQPRELQPEDVELKVVCSGVCHSDVHQLLGEWGESPRPIVCGHEIVGVVVRRGHAALHDVGARVAVGTKVGACFKCEACDKGTENYCRKLVDTYTGVHEATKTRTHGGFAYGVVVDSRFAFALPESLPSTTAAPMMCAGATVYSPLRKNVKPGDSVAVVGVSCCSTP